MVGAHLSRTPRRQLAAFPVERLGGRCDNVDYGLGHASSDGEEGSGRRADGKGEELCWGFLQNYAMPCTPCYSKRPWTCISSKQASRKVKQANGTASASTFRSTTTNISSAPSLFSTRTYHAHPAVPTLPILLQRRHPHSLLPSASSGIPSVRGRLSRRRLFDLGRSPQGGSRARTRGFDSGCG
jgi:hypothetical protein